MNHQSLSLLIHTDIICIKVFTLLIYATDRRRKNKNQDPRRSPLAHSNVSPSPDLSLSLSSAPVSFPCFTIVPTFTCNRWSRLGPVSYAVYTVGLYPKAKVRFAKTVLVISPLFIIVTLASSELRA